MLSPVVSRLFIPQGVLFATERQTLSVRPFSGQSLANLLESADIKLVSENRCDIALECWARGSRVAWD